MRALEVFSGTKGIGTAFEAHGYEVVSLDKDPRFEPTICEDILTWDYTVFSVDHFDAVWASPECTQYSIARSNARTPRDLEGADAMVQTALDIIDCFQPRAWFLENPQSGLLKTREVIAGLPYVDDDYCKFNYPYRKRTRIWTNTPLRSRLCEHDCDASDGKRHAGWAQKGNGNTGDGFSRAELYAMPKELCEEKVQASILQ